ncbi:hypothetical protein FH609_020785 [Streptomyces sp. 3MP-14]|uniref:Carrier domain-containing protein n=1 Tax=Streptomyces mimosae TaxID=2586635 RepID=A0A5N5ZZN5_9ACTN|nr:MULTISPECIES: phosphopantetheine-binding protein [Streptomyces]KAB8161725.1 hypothetical protein FH607_023635 [Streptomyces mimosae]KAB8175007.1 hypothetical protein FH609_020785 [Streptomyces sp. 3MP-14]
MADRPTEENNVRERVLAVVENILGYPPDAEKDDLSGLDSLQVLELLVLLEEEFDIDSDEIVEAQLDWWTSLNGLVSSITSLTEGKRAGERQHG